MCSNNNNKTILICLHCIDDRAAAHSYMFCDCAESPLESIPIPLAQLLRVFCWGINKPLYLNTHLRHQIKGKSKSSGVYAQVEITAAADASCVHCDFFTGAKRRRRRLGIMRCVFDFQMR